MEFHLTNRNGTILFLFETNKQERIRLIKDDETDVNVSTENTSFVVFCGPMTSEIRACIEKNAAV